MEYPKIVRFGWDVAKRQDYSALVAFNVVRTAIGQKVSWTPGKMETDWRGVFWEKYMKRVAGMDYTQHVRWVVGVLVEHRMNEILRGQNNFESDRILSVREIYVDCTGVGSAVADMLYEALQKELYGIDVQVNALNFTSGDKYRRATGREPGSIGKLALATNLQKMIQQERILFSLESPEIIAMRNELAAYTAEFSKASTSTTLTFGASIGEHDDLCSAVGMVCLDDPFEVMAQLIPKSAFGF